MTDQQSDTRSPREILGLHLADDGDPKGVTVFLDFVSRELITMAHLCALPEALSEVLAQLQRETDRASHFANGFVAGRTNSLSSPIKPKE